MRRPISGKGTAKEDASGSEAGSALVEFSLFLPLFVFLLLGVVDFGLAIQQSMVATDAAHAGTMYATLSGKSEDTAGMTQAAQNAAAGSAVQFTVDTAANLYACSVTETPTQGTRTCSSGSPLEWAQVTTHVTLPALFGYPGLPGTFTLNGSSTLRVR